MPIVCPCGFYGWGRGGGYSDILFGDTCAIAVVTVLCCARLYRPLFFAVWLLVLPATFVYRSKSPACTYRIIFETSGFTFVCRAGLEIVHSHYIATRHTPYPLRVRLLHSPFPPSRKNAEIYDSIVLQLIGVGAVGSRET